MSKSMLPLIDLVFLTLGSVLGAMTQMEQVESIPVDVSRVGKGAAVVNRGQFDVVAVTAEGLWHNGQKVDPIDLPSRVTGKRVVLRAEKTIPTQQTLDVLARLARSGADVSLEVRQNKVELAQRNERP
ncbi:MAG: ExbD/TolR family protein [Phycisphaerae bacterium]